MKHDAWRHKNGSVVLEARSPDPREESGPRPLDDVVLPRGVSGGRGVSPEFVQRRAPKRMARNRCEDAVAQEHGLVVVGFSREDEVAIGQIKGFEELIVGVEVQAAKLFHINVSDHVRAHHRSWQPRINGFKVGATFADEG